ncbi:MAG: NAD(P)/FAD-dependent oxidoreductase [Pseudomonadota bacterium]
MEERLDLYADIDETVAAINDFSGKEEGIRYREFCRQAKAIFQTLEHPFMLSTRPSPITLTHRVGIINFKRLLQLNPFVTLWQALAKQFHDPRLQQLFGRYSTYMGSSPYQAPATLMLIAHVEQAGVWKIEGGMYQLVEAMKKLAIKAGVNFRLGTGVKKISIKNRAIESIELDSGEIIETENVIFNGDHAALGHGLLGEEVKFDKYKTKQSQRSLSAITWSMSAKTSGFPLVHHNVFFGNNYQQEFENIFKRNKLPNSPTIYVCAQDRNDNNDQTTLDKERLFCLVNAPAVGDHQNFTEQMILDCQQEVFQFLSDCGLQIDFANEDCRITTPNQFEQFFPGTGGGLYGKASHGWLASFQRPGSATPIKGLYLAGGSVHPGAGIPMAATSGKLAADRLLQDQK